MQTIRNNKGVETVIYAITFEYEAFDQVKRMINFEAYEDSKVRIMPDAHAGKGCTVGTTMTITDKVTPNLVGVDIGCGMLTVKLKEKEIDFEKLDEFIRKNVPHGFNVHSKVKRKFDLSGLRCQKRVDLERAVVSIGSLGGGNHFIEVGRGNLDDSLYLVIHSGSRKLGGDVCKHYQDLAFKRVNEMSNMREELVKRLKAEKRERDIDSELKKLQKPTTNKELAYLSGQDFDDYMHDMKIVQSFAVANRRTMADIILKGMSLGEASSFETIHNYISFDRMILRKGAISAELGETVLIPMNMRDGSLLCVGKGNPDWNYSAPHGAGRLMSRSRAKGEIDMAEFKKSMKGIYTTSVSRDTIDEAPQAYKPMEEIMEAISDTVDIIDVIRPLYNFKAHE